MIEPKICTNVASTAPMIDHEIVQQYTDITKTECKTQKCYSVDKGTAATWHPIPNSKNIALCSATGL